MFQAYFHPPNLLITWTHYVLPDFFCSGSDYKFLQYCVFPASISVTAYGVMQEKSNENLYKIVRAVQGAWNLNLKLIKQE